MNCATGQDVELLRPHRSTNGPSPKPAYAISVESKRANSVDDYLNSLPSMTADGQHSFDASKSTLIPKQFVVSRVDLHSDEETLKPLIWMSPNICYGKPYFNDDLLEKNGRTHGFFQPAYSISRLLIQTSVYPVRRTLNLGQSIECVEVRRFSFTELDWGWNPEIAEGLKHEIWFAWFNPRRCIIDRLVFQNRHFDRWYRVNLSRFQIRLVEVLLLKLRCSPSSCARYPSFVG